LVNANCAMSLPFPSNCRRQIETTPNIPNASVGAVSHRQPFDLLRSAR
jgi:hypothetical protein